MTRRMKAGFALALAAGLGLALSYGIYFQLAPEPSLGGELRERVVQWDGRERHYTFYLPPERAQGPPLLFVFHGSGGSAAQSRAMYGYAFDELADEQGFIVVYPEGYEQHYNGCRKAGPYAANALQVDDVGFMRLLVEQFTEEFGIDTRAVFATGVSNGGQMALRLALEAPDLVAAVAPVATSLPTAGNMDCRYSGIPVPFLLMNGTDDPMNPYHGGTVALYGLLGDRGEVISSRETALYWAGLAGLQGEPMRRELPDVVEADNSRVSVDSWFEPGKPAVSLYTIEGGGHNAPHPHIRLPRLLGGTNNDIVAAREIWRFFQHASGVVATP